MHKTPNAKRLKPMLAVLSLLVSACSSNSLPPAQPMRLDRPPLPAAARQPVKPSQCLPTCSAGAASDDENWRSLLIVPMAPASSASGSVKG